MANRIQRFLGIVGLLTIGIVQAAPTVSLSSPTANAVFAAPANVVISATATPSNGTTIKKVDFYRGAILIGSDTTAPYSVTWNTVPAGSYSLTAKATDSKNKSTTSAPVSISVTTPPTVSLTVPAANTVFNAPASITLMASAADTDGSVAKVEFYQGTTLVGSSTTAPYSVVWSNAPAGSYSLTAKATDNKGVTSTSAAVPIVVNAPPTVTLTSPVAGHAFTAPATVTITASASDSDGNVTKVEFYLETTLIGTASAAPYSMIWQDVPAGSYSLSARATDNRGAVAASASLSVTVASGGTAVYYLHNDHLNTPRLVMDEQNVVVWRNQPLTEPFGVALPEEDPDGNGVPFALNLRFPGQYFDKETNLHYNTFRDYDPTTGHYIQSDPFGLQGGINTYSYVGGNPMSFVDPMGLDWVWSQSAGTMTNTNNPGAVVGSGYAGHGNGVNNPALQGSPGTGPLPQGSYTIQPQQTNVTGTGVSLPGSMRLTPDPTNNMLNRAGFLIHGGNMRTRTSSAGCIVLPPSVRDTIGGSGDDRLIVVP